MKGSWNCDIFPHPENQTLETMKHLQAETTVKHTGQAATELDASLPAILQSSPGSRRCYALARQVAATGDRAFIRLHPISARREGEL
jgi:hypothetical protein